MILGEEGRGHATDLFLEHLIGTTKLACRDGQSLDKMKEISITQDLARAIAGTINKETGIKNSSSHSKVDVRPQDKEAAEALLASPRFKPPQDWKNPIMEGLRAEIKQGADFDVDDGDVGEFPDIEDLDIE